MTVYRASAGEPLTWLREVALPWSLDECLTTWPYALGWGDGRPVVTFGGRQAAAAQVVLQLAGIARPGAPLNCALHSCDAPLCLNRRHLRWGSKGDNNRDRASRGRSRTPVGPANPASKLTLDQVATIRHLATTGLTQSTIGDRFGITQSTVSVIVRGLRWREIPT